MSDKLRNSQLLYLMKNSLGIYKIGVSKDPEIRKNQIRLSSGANIEILSSFKPKINCAITLENHLHKKFKKYRKNGEWFDFGGDIDDVLFYFDNCDVKFKKQRYKKILGFCPKWLFKEYYNKIISYDESKIHDYNYTKELIDRQTEILEKLFKINFSVYTNVVETLNANGYYTSYSMMYHVNSYSYINCVNIRTNYPVVKKNLVKYSKVDF